MIERRIPTVRDLMTASRLVLDPDMDVLDAIDLLVERKVAAAAVVDGSGRLLGLLTEKDCLRVLSTSVYEDHFKGGTVADYMSQVRLALEPQMDLFHATELFLSCNFPTLPVLEDGKMAGRLNRQDMLKAVQRFIGDEMTQRTSRLAAIAAAGTRPSAIADMQRTAASLPPSKLAGLFSRNR